MDRRGMFTRVVPVSYYTVHSVRVLPCSSHTTDPLGSIRPHSPLQDPALVSPTNSSPTGTVCRSRRFSHLLETFGVHTGNKQ